MNILTKLTMSGVLVFGARGNRSPGGRDPPRLARHPSRPSRARAKTFATTTGRRRGTERRDLVGDYRDLRADRGICVADRREHSRRPGHLRNDYRDVARDRSELRADLRTGNYAAARAERQDLQSDYRDIHRDRQELAGDWRDYYYDGR